MLSVLRSRAWCGWQTGHDPVVAPPNPSCTGAARVRLLMVRSGYSSCTGINARPADAIVRALGALAERLEP